MSGRTGRGLSRHHALPDATVLLALAVAILDHALPNRKRPWRCFTPGALFFMLAWVPATLGFNFYVRHFASYSRTYGALGAFVILMVWTYITSLIALIGAEINRQLHKMRAEAKVQPVEFWRSALQGNDRVITYRGLGPHGPRS